MPNKRVKINEELLISYINTAELDMVAGSIVDIIKKYKVSDPFILGGMELLIEDIEANNAAMKKERANEFTPIVRQKEAERKNNFLALRDSAEAATKRSKPEIKEAAARITGIIRKRGWTIYSEGYAEQLKGFNHLLEDLETEEAKRDLNTIGLTGHVLDLAQVHSEFKISFNNRLESFSKANEISPVDAKEILFDDVIAFIGSMNLLGARSTGQYDAVLNDINESIAGVMTTARARKTRDNNAGDDEQTTA